MSPDEVRVVTVSQVNPDAETRELWRMKGGAPSMSSDGTRVAIVDLSVVPTVFRIIDVASRRVVADACSRPSGGNGVWSPDGVLFACVHGGTPTEEWVLEIWDMNGRKISAHPTEYGAQVIAWSR